MRHPGCRAVHTIITNRDMARTGWLGTPLRWLSLEETGLATSGGKPWLTDAARPAWQRVAWLAWPAFLQQMLILVIHVSDRWLAGHASPDGEGTDLAAQAAHTTCFYLGWVMSSYGTLVSVGATALVSRAVGAGNPGKANRLTHQSLLLAAGLGCLATVLAIPPLEQLLALLQLDGPARGLAKSYLTPLIVAFPLQLLSIGASACLAGAGDTRTGLWVLGGVATLNIPLTWWFFHGGGGVPELGFAGIAIGTAVSQTAGALALLVVLALGRAGLELRSSLFAPNLADLKSLLAVSLPAALDSLSIAMGQLVFMGMVNSLGDASRGAHGIALGWEALGFLTGAAFGTAGMTLVGQNLGAGSPAEARRCGWTAFLMGAVAMSMMGILFHQAAQPMFGLFCPRPEQAPIMRLGVPVLQLVAFSMPALSAVIVLTSVLRGAGDSAHPLVYTWIGFLGVRLPLAALLALDSVTVPGLIKLAGAGMGLYGCWLAMQADIHVRGALFLWRFQGDDWLKTRV